MRKETSLEAIRLREAQNQLIMAKRSVVDAGRFVRDAERSVIDAEAVVEYWAAKLKRESGSV